MNYHELLEHEPLSKMFIKGTILWRPVAHGANGNCTADPFEWLQTERGSWMTRLQMQGQFIFEPELGGKVGIVVFAKKKPPDDWTHMVIDGVSKALQKEMPYDERANIDGGGAIFVKHIRSFKMEHYLKFREQYQEEYTEIANSNFERAIQLSLDVWPEGYKVGDRRLILGPTYKTNPRYNYVHLVIKNNSKGEDRPRDKSPDDSQSREVPC